MFFFFRFLRQYVAHQFFLRLPCLFIRLFFCFRYQFKSFKDDRFRLLVKVKFFHRLFLELGSSILRASPSIVFEWSPLLAFNALYFLFLYSVSDDWCPFRSLENHVMLTKILRTPLPHPPQVKVNNWFPTISLTSRPRVLPIVSIQDGAIRSNKMQDSQQSFRVLRCDHRPCCQRRREEDSQNSCSMAFCRGLFLVWSIWSD